MLTVLLISLARWGKLLTSCSFDKSFNVGIQIKNHVLNRKRLNLILRKNLKRKLQLFSNLECVLENFSVYRWYQIWHHILFGCVLKWPMTPFITGMKRIINTFSDILTCNQWRLIMFCQILNDVFVFSLHAEIPILPFWWNYVLFNFQF